jgi:broad specificity phosphatase PhoE
VRLLLMRHAQSVGNAAQQIQGWDDQPLTDVGRAQAAACQTAEIVGGQLGLTVHCDDRLKEYHCGAITGMCFAEVAAQFPEVARGWREDPWHTAVPGEEGLGVFQQRVLSAIGDIVDEHSDSDTMAIMTHGGTLSAYMADLLGLDFRKRQPWVFDNASLSTVILGGLRPRIASLNDICHLNHLLKGSEQ